MRRAVVTWDGHMTQDLPSVHEGPLLSGSRRVRHLQHLRPSTRSRCATVARWGRNTWESLRNIDALHQAGGFIVSASENLDDIATPMGRFTLTQYAAIAQLQSDQIGQSWRDTHEYRRSKGMTPTGGPRWAYVWDNTTEPEHSPDPTLVDAVRQSYLSYIGGVSFASLVRTLRTQGVKTADGTEFKQRPGRPAWCGHQACSTRLKARPMDRHRCGWQASNITTAR